MEKYLVRCLKSIFNQEFSGSYEVIAVDDGSTDNSLNILQDYQMKNNNLKVVSHGINKKLSIARSSGIKVSKGDYIMHVDSDDWLLPNTLTILFNICNKTNAEVVAYNYIIKEKNSKDILPEDRINKEILSSDKMEIQKHFFGASINKIVKRQLTENMIYGTVDVNSTEDLLYNYEILLKANTFYLLPMVLYVYARNPESLTNSVPPEVFIQDQVKIFNQVQLIAEKYEADHQLTENLLYYHDKWLYLRIARMHFGHQISKDKSLELISNFSKMPILSQKRFIKLKSTINNKFYSLIEVARRLGVRTALGIIYRNLKG